MKRVNGWIVLASALAVSLAAPAAYPAIAVSNVALSLPANVTYYTGGVTRQLGFTSLVTTGDLQSAASAPGVYDYQLLNTTLVFSQDSLVTDNSSGNIAKGDFAGGGTITLTGDLKNKTTGVTVYTNQTLLTATMAIPSSQTWTLQEQASYIMGAVYFNPTGGMLYNGTLLNIGQFRLAISTLPMPNPVDFTLSQKSLVTRIEMTSVVVPEPATLAVIGLGGLLLRKWKA